MARNKRQMRVEFSMKWLLALAAAIVLLFGCIGVSQEKYDALKSSCDQEKKDLTADADALNGRVAEFSDKLSSCTSTKQGTETLLASKESELAKANERVAVLDRAAAKAAEVVKVQTLQGYYNDAFGPGSVPNSMRISRIEQQLVLISDSSLTASWKKVINCASLSECNSAKSNFTAYLDSEILRLALETVNIVKYT